MCVCVCVCRFFDFNIKNGKLHWLLFIFVFGKNG